MLPDVIVVNVGPDGSVVLHVPTSRYWQLDRRATEIVALLAEHGHVGRAARALAETRGLTFDQATTDVCTVLNSFGDVRGKYASPPRRISAHALIDVGRSWLGLSSADKLGTVVATGLLCLIELGFRTTDIRRLARWLRVPLSDDVGMPAPNKGPAEMSIRDRRTIYRVEWVLARWLYPPTCLRRALLAGFFLRARHPVLRLGLMADGKTAHAWIEAEGRSYWITDGLTPFARPTSGSEPEGGPTAPIPPNLNS